MQVLVVEAHEGELDALELALLDVGLGRRRGRARRPSASRRRSADPLPTPGICRICLRRSVCAIAGWAKGLSAVVAAPRAATLPASLRKRRRLTGRARCAFLQFDAIGTPPVSETFPSDRFRIVFGSCSTAPVSDAKSRATTALFKYEAIRAGVNQSLRGRQPVRMRQIKPEGAIAPVIIATTSANRYGSMTMRRFARRGIWIRRKRTSMPAAAAERINDRRYMKTLLRCFREATTTVVTPRSFHMKPSSSRANSDIRDLSHGGSQTSATWASVTPSTARTLASTSPGMTLRPGSSARSGSS